MTILFKLLSLPVASPLQIFIYFSDMSVERRSSHKILAAAIFVRVRRVENGSSITGFVERVRLGLLGKCSFSRRAQEGVFCLLRHVHCDPWH